MARVTVVEPAAEDGVVPGVPFAAGQGGLAVIHEFQPIALFKTITPSQVLDVVMLTAGLSPHHSSPQCGGFSVGMLGYCGSVGASQ